MSAGGLPELRHPSQASYGDVGDPVPVQIHDSVDGLTEEFHLAAVSAGGDALEGQRRTNQSPSQASLSSDVCICGFGEACAHWPGVNSSSDP